MRPERPNRASANGGIALLLQSTHRVAAIAELGSLGRPTSHVRNESEFGLMKTGKEK
jgi:hypothetical protein